MPFDLEKIAEVLLTLFIGSSMLLLTGAIAWRIGMKPTMRALLEDRTARAGADPLLSRRVTELEEEVRGLKERLAALPESNPTRLLGADVPGAGRRRGPERRRSQENPSGLGRRLARRILRTIEARFRGVNRNQNATSERLSRQPGLTRA